ncbi:MAG: HFX_2341 family transcriptional regulator domain-containing protein [Candidatus Heimdallarchaeaceae archaeon]
MKKVHIVTVGTQAGSVFDGVRHFGADVLYLLHSNRKDIIENARYIKRTIKQMGYSCSLKPINIYDVNSVIETILGVAKNHLEDNIFVNISGGLNYIAAAAQIGAYLVGAKVYFIRYWEKETDRSVKDKVIELPLPKIRPTELKKTKRKILEYIEKNPGCINKEVAEKCRITKQMSAIHIHDLIRDNLVKGERIGRIKRLFITNSGKLILKIIK